MSNMLRHYRRTRQIKQVSIARVTGISSQVISALECEYSKPGIIQARILADFFGVKVESLFPDGTKPSRPRGRPRHEEYVPPDPPAPGAQACPARFCVRCWKCGARICLRTCDYHPLLDPALYCWACGAQFQIREI